MREPKAAVTSILASLLGRPHLLRTKREGIVKSLVFLTSVLAAHLPRNFRKRHPCLTANACQRLQEGAIGQLAQTLRLACCEDDVDCKAGQGSFWLQQASIAAELGPLLAGHAQRGCARAPLSWQAKAAE